MDSQISTTPTASSRTPSAQDVDPQIESARQLQAAILPTEFPKALNITAVARMQSARHMSGDFYDFIELPDGRIGLVIADVSGKGIPAAFFMAIARTTLRAAALRHVDPGQCLVEANAELVRQNPQLLFITVAYVIIDPWSLRVELALAGHEPLLLGAADGSVSSVPADHGIALGIIEEVEYPVTVFELMPGETLFAYTDGLTEAENNEQAFYGMERLQQSLKCRSGPNASEALDSIYKDIALFSGDHPQHDDITAWLLRVNDDAQRLA